MTNKHPRLRSHTRRRKSGKVVVYYVYDRRPDGLPDVSLGTDYEAALRRWDELHNRAPRIAGTVEEAFSAWEQRVLPTYDSPETRKGYTKALRHLRPVFGEATWDGVLLRDLRGYLDARTGKTQANREMALFSVVWNWARVEGYTELHWPAAGMARSRWRNPEQPRRFKPTDDLFAAVYAQADQVLRDCMDLASATGMRLTDCREILLPREGEPLVWVASKTRKEGSVDPSASAVLPAILARRRAIRASHLMLLSTPTGRPVSATMLRARWDRARSAAAAVAEQAGDEALAGRIGAMVLRDMRKLASRHAGSLAAASELLQHGDQRVTALHYPQAPKVLKPAR